jgi:hypothetical protein
MGIFSSKPKFNTESFCELYYNNQIFHTITDGEDSSQKVIDAAFKMLTDSEQSFSRVDRNIFDFEMTAMHLELFALAFCKRFSNFDHQIQQSIFTLHFLQNKNKIDIWEAMLKYNHAVAQTATMNANGQPMAGDTAIGRMTITRVNLLRANLFDKYMTHFKDPKHLTKEEDEIAFCVARVGNRIEADILRNNQIGNRRISALFLYRLGAENIWGADWQPSEDFLLKLASQPLSIYEFARDRLKTVDLQFSQSK